MGHDQTVLVIVDDLFFLSKIQATLNHLGLPARTITNPGALYDHLRTCTPALAVVDLTLRAADAVSLIKIIRTAARGASVPILAFGAHVAVDVRQQALQAGADRVVAKSEFSRHLPDLIRRLTRLDQ